MMNTVRNLRFTLSVALIASALMAHAIAVSLVSSGTFTQDPMDSNLFTQDETVLVSHISPLPNLVSLHVEGVYSPFTTVATYTSPSGTLVLDLLYESTAIGGFGTSTDSGTWVYNAASTGAYAGYSGMGSYAISYNADDNQFASTTVVGSLDAVPEPTSLAALGLGALAFTRRRRKA